MKKVFGGINLTWPKVIIMAVLIGLYTGVMAMIPIARNTSLSDLAVTFEVWIFFGIFIIMNSKSPKDSALKCFIFFLISQPIVYLIQDVINGSILFKTYYKYWFIWTIFTIPMGYIGYYMKKDRWWGALILTPILLLLGMEYSRYFSSMMYQFPRHLLTTIFCFATLIIYPLAIFKNKKPRYICLVVSIVLIVIISILSLIKPHVYSTDILLNEEKYHFDSSCSVKIGDSKYGDLSIKYDNNLDDYLVHADFKHAGKTEFEITCPDKEKLVFDLIIKDYTYDIEQRVN